MHARSVKLCGQHGMFVHACSHLLAIYTWTAICLTSENIATYTCTVSSEYVTWILVLNMNFITGTCIALTAWSTHRCWNIHDGMFDSSLPWQLAGGQCYWSSIISH